jgi:hypothetical protein
LVKQFNLKGHYEGKSRNGDKEGPLPSKEEIATTRLSMKTIWPLVMIAVGLMFVLFSGRSAAGAVDYYKSLHRFLGTPVPSTTFFRLGFISGGITAIFFGARELLR